MTRYIKDRNYFQYQDQEEEQTQFQYMWKQYSDHKGGLFWDMLPEYYYYFDDFLKLIDSLRHTVNKKWRDEQIRSYTKCLNDLQYYIRNYILTGLIPKINTFRTAMEKYGLTSNPLGKELYNKQIDYIEKKQSGHDFILDKRNKKLHKAKVYEQPIKVQKVHIENKKVVKKDPMINIQSLMSTDWPRDTYVNINQFKKQNINIVFLGHVDSGKSTLTGNILKQLHEVDERQLASIKQQVKKNNMQSRELASIADIYSNERQRGKTVEYAKFNFALEKRRFTIFDVPGNKNYVPNMMMGACQTDIAVLIISSKKGQFEFGFEREGQTREHALLAKALGVSSLLVAVTKMSTHDWSQQRFNSIKDQVTPFLEYSCGFNNVAFVPLDSIDNINIHKRAQSKWYNGPCLIEILNNIDMPQRKPLGPLRIPIIDQFKELGNLYLFGKIESGTIIEDQTITILPSKSEAIIKQIFNSKDERLPFAMPGENVKLKMKGIDQNDAKRGYIICSNLNYCQEVYEFKATVNILQIPEAKKLISSGYQCVLHMHAIVEQVEIFKVQAKYDSQSKKNVIATFLKSGQTGIVTIKCSNILCLEKYQYMHRLGQFTLRDGGKTIGYGLVTKIKIKSLIKQ